MKKKSLVFIITMLLVCCMIVPTQTYAASTKKEKVKVEKVVKKFYSAAKSYQTSKMVSCFRRGAKNEAFWDKQYVNLIKRYNKKFLKYKIKSTKISSSSKYATVKVRCTYLNCYSSFYLAMGDTVWYLIQNNPNATEKQIQNYLCNRSKKYIRSGKWYKNATTVTLKLRKINGKWKIDKWSTRLNDSINCGYQSAYNDYF